MRRPGLRSLAAVLPALLLWACASPSDRVILLPGADGRASGAVAVRTVQGEALLAEPYAQATVAGGRIEAGKTTAEQVKADFGPLLATQPARARQWTVYFEAGGNALTAESRAALDELRMALASFPAGEVIVTGHTDRVGSVADNDRLSAVRAATVRDLLIGAGVPADRISVQGRGEREPIVPTADEVAEPRNRRVEIKLR
jgi:outer membrane protein OmpA-like peptidoglycan-associated protein